MEMNFEIGTEKNCPNCEILSEKLNRYNHEFAGPYNDTALNIFAKDDDGEIIGGLIGMTYWGWLYVDTLILDDDKRGNGLGSTILNMAEKEAKRRGCRGVHLDTHDFQAREFYESHGYRLNSTIENLPVGHFKYQMIKQL